jgi:acetyltransferase-like isoleucine patch superfamily enzyme
MNFKKPLKLIFQKCILPWFKYLSYFFYQKKFLQGRLFEQEISGWVYVIKGIWFQKILGFNRKIPFPCHPTAIISSYKNIIFHVDDIQNFQSPGVYWQCFKGKIYLGKGSYIAPNVGLITVNHNLENLDTHQNGKDIVIGKNCWIGMNSVILPGVCLGDHTIVGAGSVVTKPFTEGHCVIPGNPAKKIRKLTTKSLQYPPVKSG